jgi:hypothetical protein
MAKQITLRMYKQARADAATNVDKKGPVLLGESDANTAQAVLADAIEILNKAEGPGFAYSFGIEVGIRLGYLIGLKKGEASARQPKKK